MMDDIYTEEKCTAVKALKNNKAPGIDEVNPELLSVVMKLLSNSL